MTTLVKFYEPSFVPGDKLTYSVIAGRYNNSWIFVRHRERSTFEIAGGHIEEGESALEAAQREFREETGSTIFAIDCVATYSVEKDGTIGFGRLFFARVSEMGPVPYDSEIAEVCLLDHLPENLTHPDIQPFLFKNAKEYYENKRLLPF